MAEITYLQTWSEDPIYSEDYIFANLVRGSYLEPIYKPGQRILFMPRLHIYRPGQNSYLLLRLHICKPAWRILFMPRLHITNLVR
jgi:hypothetical protein